MKSTKRINYADEKYNETEKQSWSQRGKEDLPDPISGNLF